MNVVQQFARVAAGAAALVPGAVAVRPMMLEADWPSVRALLRAEEWPFEREDLELGDAQPIGVSRVAERAGEVAGFFTTHGFARRDGAPVGYLDMMIVGEAHRGHTVARPLYLAAMQGLHEQGVRGLVVHTTNDSAPLIRALGFAAGADYTLLVRDPAPALPAPLAPIRDREAIVALDAAVFGTRRERWIGTLLDQPRVRFVTAGGGIACLRPRAGDARCLDGVDAPDDDGVRALVDGIVAAEGPARRLECFARTGSALHRRLEEHGFEVPAFFRAIGPLVEWRLGATGGLGAGERVQCLMWL